MNVFNLVKDILELIYYVVGIAGIYMIYNTIKENNNKAVKELADKITKSQTAYNSLKELLSDELKKDSNGETKYKQFCFSSDIIQYFKGNGDLKTSKNFENIKNDDSNENQDNVYNVLNCLRDSFIYLEQEEELENDFRNNIKEYLANAIFIITKNNYNYEYKTELQFIAKKLGIEKPDTKVFRNNLWKELCK